MIVSVLILAAGQGLRMHSSTPKVLHRLAGKPLIRYSFETACSVSSQKPVVVIGHAADKIRNELGDLVDYVIQTPQLGTGHAVQAAETQLKDTTDQLVVISADMPLLTARTLKAMADLQKETGSVMVMLSIHSESPHGFGRVIRDEESYPVAIVEEAQASEEQLKCTELNAGAYCFDAHWLWDALKKIKVSPKGEFYLTDLLEIAVGQGEKVQVYTLADASEALGINNRTHLAEAEMVVRKRVNNDLMLSGVTIIDPAITYIEPGVSIGKDTIIYPNTHLRGSTVIGEQCIIGPNTIIDNTQIGSRCIILCSVLESAVLEDDVEMGPFGHLRKGAHLATGVHMGNFGEIKNSYLGPETKMGHFSYIGDAQIGSDVNIGAGTITCNFDGVNKNKTVLADGVFVGSDTMLVAPVKMGEGARSGAGAVVTKDVPPHTTVVGVPARPIIKKETSE
ncbi:MAG: bifunctional UDP-N-acetylglucosamine diphosphorylase/glucosamine-1-phosphate N-acetyltransferase GlmU [Chloroflexi bacterium]|nr:bifunctional UDP-N-acetylglucosamine diphosphorylase/glucosamine-1-phosphate N-acetyltransferase GlmU [Chloroflexota bacterium]